MSDIAVLPRRDRKVLESTTLSCSATVSRSSSLSPKGLMSRSIPIQKVPACLHKSLSEIQRLEVEAMAELKDYAMTIRLQKHGVLIEEENNVSKKKQISKILDNLSTSSSHSRNQPFLVGSYNPAETGHGSPHDTAGLIAAACLAAPLHDDEDSHVDNHDDNDDHDDEEASLAQDYWDEVDDVIQDNLAFEDDLAHHQHQHQQHQQQLTGPQHHHEVPVVPVVPEDYWYYPSYDPQKDHHYPQQHQGVTPLLPEQEEIFELDL